MQSITAFHLSKMLLKASTRVIENKDKINAINVFPVADSDTGSNLANTFLGIKQLLEKQSFVSSIKFVDKILASAFENSRGNSGIMMASFLKGFLNSLKDKDKFYLADFKNAAKLGEDYARESMQKPVKGTMLDATEAFSLSLQNDNVSITDAFYNSTQKIKTALFNTEKKLKVLKENHVVDAGALGFTYFVYGLYEGLSGKHLDLELINSKPKIKREDNNEFSHEVIFTIQKTSFSSIEIREMLNPLGESLDIIEIEEKMKIHIHTNTPDVVRQTAHSIGETLEIRIVDMSNSKRKTQSSNLKLKA